MRLSGETIRKIREALKSAFPNRDELVMMLHMEFDIPESEVPNNSNYNLVVFHLIQQLDRQNRIPELIKGALNERPGNPDVQKIAQEINAIYSNLSNESVLKWFEFDVVTVNTQGWKISRKRCRAQYFTEDLGNGVTLEMVAIPGGTFMMGAPKNEKESTDDERPQHQVTVQPFFMGKYPVTQAQWRAVAALPQLRSCTYPYKPGFSQKQRNKVTLFLLAFLSKIRALGFVLSVKIPSIFLGARCEPPTGAINAPAKYETSTFL